MMTFKTPLILTPLDGPSRLFSLEGPFNVFTNATGENIDISIEKGFVTDLASVPSLCSFVIENDSPRITKAAVPHDDLYSRRGKIHGHTLTRKQADLILVDGMKSLGASIIQRSAVWLAVRSFGWRFWNDKQTDPSPSSVPQLTERSSKWRFARSKFLADHDYCAWCGGKTNLQVHHIKPVHLFPELELITSNFVTLCEHPMRRCHLLRGHLGNWTNWNPNILNQIVLK